jgi:predicted enzyme related to lactoylglutathione lyase
MEPVGSFLFVTIDCADPDALAVFWAGLLGTEVDTAMDDGRFVFLKGTASLPVMCFQRVPEAKSGKSRTHLDLSVPDLAVATKRVVELGGSWPDQAERKLEGFIWRTLADPEGNEFDIALAQ